jgi:hypothetical protein
LNQVETAKGVGGGRGPIGGRRRVGGVRRHHASAQAIARSLTPALEPELDGYPTRVNAATRLAAVTLVDDAYSSSQLIASRVAPSLAEQKNAEHAGTVPRFVPRDYVQTGELRAPNPAKQSRRLDAGRRRF